MSTKDGTTTIDLGASPGWEALSEAHRQVTLEGMRARAEAARQEARQDERPKPEPGTAQAGHESPEDYFRREAEWARLEAED